MGLRLIAKTILLEKIEAKKDEKASEKFSQIYSKKLAVKSEKSNGKKVSKMDAKMSQENGGENDFQTLEKMSPNELIERVKTLEKENENLQKKLAKNSAKKTKPVRFTMRVAGGEYDLIKEKAEAVKRSVASFLVEAGLDKNIMLPEDAAAYRKEISATVFELKKIGNNLNHAMHQAHLDAKFSEAQSLEEMITEINAGIGRAIKYL